MLLFAAVLPAIVLLTYVYRHDRVEKEPTGLLVKLVMLGCLAVVPAIVLEAVGERMMFRAFPYHTFTAAAVENFLVIALSEELSKYLMLRLATWKSPHFNCSFDGVVYAAFVSLGFALLENIFYVLSNDMSVAVARAVLSVPGHCSYGIFMGCWYSRAYRCHLQDNAAGERAAIRATLIVPVLLHGAYDFLVDLQTAYGSTPFLIFVAVSFIATFRMLRKLSREDEYLRIEQAEGPIGAWGVGGTARPWSPEGPGSLSRDPYLSGLPSRDLDTIPPLGSEPWKSAPPEDPWGKR